MSAESPRPQHPPPQEASEFQCHGNPAFIAQSIDEPRLHDTTAANRKPLWNPHQSAWVAFSSPINEFLNEPDVTARDALTKKWAENTDKHLNSIVMTSAIIGGVVATALGWPAFVGEQNTEVHPCVSVVKAFWYCSLAFLFGAIASAGQQLTALHRLDCHPEALEMIRSLLRKPPPQSKGLRSHTQSTAQHLRVSQLVLWQTPVTLLNGSLYLFVVGLSIFVYWDLTTRLSAPVVVVLGVLSFTVCLFVTIILWGISSVGLYYWIGQLAALS